MKLGNHSRSIIIFLILLVALTVLVTQVDSVQATFTNMHAVTVLLRVETEIMQKTPAGQYYESLFWKHNDELMQIASQHPENNEEFWRVTRLFIPSLEALLDGEGDTVQITFEQVESLKAELDWLAAAGSTGLREDIQKEQQRLPLDALVGMTMNQALDFINSNWAPESLGEKTLVPGSDGNWAYFVYNGIYLEYPNNYSLQISGSEKDYIYFVPLQGLPEQWNPCVMKVRIWKVPINEKEINNPRSWYLPENILWEGVIQNAELSGVEFIVSRPDSSGMHFHAFQYNDAQQLAVDIWVFVTESAQFPEDFDYFAMINQQYEYFQHMVDTIKLDPSSISELPIQLTPMPDVFLQLTPTPYVVEPPLVSP